MASRVLHPSAKFNSLCRLGSTPRSPVSPISRIITPPSSTRTFSFSLQRPFQSTKYVMSTDALIQAAQNRHSIYKLGKNSPVPDAKIEELVNAAILNVPSSFNTQSTRLVILLHDQHDRLWDIAAEAFRERVAAGSLAEEVWKNQTEPKLQGFKNAYGTILFYEDPAHIKPFQEKFPAYKDHFEPWAVQSNAMHQYFLWTALETLGFGANLQHYNPLIDAPVAKEWSLPTEWRLVAQLVFGSPEAEGAEKPKKPVEERVKFYGKQ
ncbi:nitroreductase family protein [Penicillium chermesinum]|uniref:Nitroreductase family protein n=1 Tax=Penicillium chermesinum TaxID=63820 RepID=A0A9W9NBV1_9EURO|nr:nitroreductase family protein [Penicillium chermesinum]KAJ5216959.1 nitroreductase family protein [Penicillium chermesinum]KAJ6171427.1 nitroreductase family protein [Penicillium chermesinum]